VGIGFVEADGDDFYNAYALARRMGLLDTAFLVIGSVVGLTVLYLAVFAVRRVSGLVRSRLAGGGAAHQR
jgi:hypothetical protein